MKIALVVAMLATAAAGSAAAAEKITDLDYIRAERCRGLAEGSGLTETKGLDEYLKSAGRGRMEIAEQRATAEYDRARRDAKRDGGKERYAAELNGACTAYMGGPQNTASSRAAPAS